MERVQTVAPSSEMLPRLKQRPKTLSWNARWIWMSLQLCPFQVELFNHHCMCSLFLSNPAPRGPVCTSCWIMPVPLFNLWLPVFACCELNVEVLRGCHLFTLAYQHSWHLTEWHKQHQQNFSSQAPSSLKQTVGKLYRDKGRTRVGKEEPFSVLFGPMEGQHCGSRLCPSQHAFTSAS